MFHLSSRSIKLTIERGYVMPSNKLHTLGLAIFLHAGCNKTIHMVHDNATLKLNDEETYIPTSVIINSLDYAKLDIIPPTESDVNNMDKEAFTPESHKIRLNEVTLNNALMAHERGLHSSFLNYYQLS